MDGPWMLTLTLSVIRLVFSVISWWSAMSIERARARAIGWVLWVAGPDVTIEQCPATGSLVITCDKGYK
jgi:hypothetical protein